MQGGSCGHLASDPNADTLQPMHCNVHDSEVACRAQMWLTVVLWRAAAGRHACRRRRLTTPAMRLRSCCARQVHLCYVLPVMVGFLMNGACSAEGQG